ncbi:hypothetical protein K439DRAFT_138447 [Ramaria rubella]|nr:hypothetical protein K439DRAFT_138447 [Ramaria rubella]
MQCNGDRGALALNASPPDVHRFPLIRNAAPSSRRDKYSSIDVKSINGTHTGNDPGRACIGPSRHPVLESAPPKCSMIVRPAPPCRSVRHANDTRLRLADGRVSEPDPGPARDAPLRSGPGWDCNAESKDRPSPTIAALRALAFARFCRAFRAATSFFAACCIRTY